MSNRTRNILRLIGLILIFAINVGPLDLPQGDSAERIGYMIGYYIFPVIGAVLLLFSVFYKKGMIPQNSNEEKTGAKYWIYQISKILLGIILAFMILSFIGQFF